jgi:uncharacterized protein
MEGLKSYTILHPLLNREIAHESPNQSSMSEEDYYYKKKYQFLTEHNAFIPLEISFITKPDPNEIKIKIANLKQLVFEVTESCNLKCAYCAYGELYNNYDKRLSRKMSFNKIQKICDYMIDLWHSSYNHSHNNTVDISFFGGEPLLNIDVIKKTIVYLENNTQNSDLFFTYRMTTNGMFIDRYMSYIVSKNFNLLISIDGDEASNSYRITKKGENSFHKIYKNIILLKDTYPEYFKNKVEFNALLHDRNTYEDIYTFIYKHFGKIPLVSELAINGIRSDKKDIFKKMFKSTYEHQKEALKNLSFDKKNLFSKSENIIFRSMLHGHSGNMYKSLNDLLKNQSSILHMPSGTCMAFNKKVFVTVTGKILPCEKIGHHYSLGNVDDIKGVNIDFENISSFYDKMYTPLLKLCKQCYHQVNCGQCVFQIYERRYSEKLECSSFVNKKAMALFLSNNISYIEEHPAVYEEIIHEDMLS